MSTPQCRRNEKLDNAGPGANRETSESKAPEMTHQRPRDGLVCAPMAPPRPAEVSMIPPQAGCHAPPPGGLPRETHTASACGTEYAPVGGMRATPRWELSAQRKMCGWRSPNGHLPPVAIGSYKHGRKYSHFHST